MNCSGTVLESDYIAAQYLHMKPRKAFTIIGLVLIFLSTITLVIWFSWLMLACLGYLLVFYFILVPWRAAKTYRQYKAIQDPITIELKDSGILSSSKNGSGIIEWNAIRKIKKKNTIIGLPSRFALSYLP